MQDVKQDASGLQSGPGSQQSDPLASLIASQAVLAQALAAQTQGMAAMTESILLLVEAMAEGDGVGQEDVPAKVGLNGRPL